MLWGVDLGGTKIEVAVLETASVESLVFRSRIDTQAEGGALHIADRIRTLVDMAAQKIGQPPKIIGIGTPGTIDPGSGLLKNSNTTCLNGRPFKDDLQKALGIPVKIANDANCFALAETLMGAIPESAPDARVVFGVIMGTGVGGGVVIDKKTLYGAHGIGGEWGHIHLDNSGGSCYCGLTGCVETVISGKALQRFYEQQTGESKSLKEIVQLSMRGDVASIQTITRLIHFFGKGLATVVNILDPDVIVLGGGVGNVAALYDRGVESVRKFVFNPTLKTKFLRPKLGDSAGVFGAALLVTEQE